MYEDGKKGEWMYKGMMLLGAAQLMNFDPVNMMKVQAEANAREMEPMLKLLQQQSREEIDAANLNWVT